MGLISSSPGDDWELAVDKTHATLYYFSGRGLADQLRWMMAATDVTFTQKVISHRDQLAKMARQQLPFGQLPLLQIDGIEIVQSQAAVRYLARRARLEGKSPEEQLKCDMVAETVRDLLSLLCAAPFKRCDGLQGSQDESSSSSEKDVRAALTPAELENPAWVAHQQVMREKWLFVGGRFEAILRSNARRSHTETHKESGSEDEAPLYVVGESLTYADILVAHVTTWFVEECGAEIVKDMPLLVSLQRCVVSLPGLRAFFKSINYFPIGNLAYVEQVRKVLNKDL